MCVNEEINKHIYMIERIAVKLFNSLSVLQLTFFIYCYPLLYTSCMLPKGSRVNSVQKYLCEDVT